MTYLLPELLERKSICSTCEFLQGSMCSKTELRTNVQIYEICPEDKWPKIKRKRPRKKKNTPIWLQYINMGISALRSFSRWILNGFPKTKKQLLNERLAICRDCEFWDGAALGGTGRCLKCGCSTWAKLRMATEKCPIDKWGPAPQPTKRKNAKTKRAE